MTDACKQGSLAPLQAQQGLPFSGPISPGAEREQKLMGAASSGDEPLCQAHRKTASPGSTWQPVVTHRGPLSAWSRTLRNPPAIPPPPHTLQDPLCTTSSGLRMAQVLGWVLSPLQRLVQAPRGGLMSFHHALPGHPWPQGRSSPSLSIEPHSPLRGWGHLGHLLPDPSGCSASIPNTEQC